MSFSGRPVPVGDHELQLELDDILDAPLQAETIDNFADLALSKLCKLSDVVVKSYSTRPTIVGETQTTNEDCAFNYFQLGDMPQILDHVSQKVQEIRSINSIIEYANVVPTVIVPPDAITPPIGDGESQTAREQRIIDRTKTVLFILSNSFDIDLHNPDQLSIYKGEIRSSMMRNESYFAVNAPMIDRLILVCDELGNATFVFDTAAAEAEGLNSNKLITSTKQEIEKFLQLYPEVGVRLIYSEKYVENMINAIQSPKTRSGLAQPSQSTYLRPSSKTQEEVLSLNGLAKKYNLSSQTVQKIIGEIDEHLGEPQFKQFGSRWARAFNFDDEQAIKQVLHERGLDSPKNPEGVLAVQGLARQRGLSSKTIEAAIESIPAEKLGPVQDYHFGNGVFTGYTSEQQAMIDQALEAQGAFIPRAPEGILSIRGISAELQVDKKRISRIVDELADELGEIGEYRFGPKTARGFNPEQQMFIKNHLKDDSSLIRKAEKRLGTEIHSSEVLNSETIAVSSASRIAKKYHIAPSAVREAIGNLTDSLGDTQYFKFGSMVAPGYDEQQENLIVAELVSSGRLVEEAPEDVLSVRGIAQNCGVDPKTIRKIIKTLEEEIGDVANYRFGATYAKGYTPEQQLLITERLSNR